MVSYLTDILVYFSVRQRVLFVLERLCHPAVENSWIISGRSYFWC